MKSKGMNRKVCLFLLGISCFENGPQTSRAASRKPTGTLEQNVQTSLPFHQAAVTGITAPWLPACLVLIMPRFHRAFFIRLSSTLPACSSIKPRLTEPSRHHSSLPLQHASPATCLVYFHRPQLLQRVIINGASFQHCLA